MSLLLNQQNTETTCRGNSLKRYSHSFLWLQRDPTVLLVFTACPGSSVGAPWWHMLGTPLQRGVQEAFETTGPNFWLCSFFNSPFHSSIQKKPGFQLKLKQTHDRSHWNIFRTMTYHPSWDIDHSIHVDQRSDKSFQGRSTLQF